MIITNPVEQIYQREVLNQTVAYLTSQNVEKRTAALGMLRQEFLFTSANDTILEFDFKTPGCGRNTPFNQNSTTEVLLDQSTRFIALYVGFCLFRRDDTASTGPGSAFSLDYSYPNSAVFVDAGATTAFTALEAVYNGYYQWQQTKTLSQLKFPMRAHREVPTFISRNQEAAAADTETPLQPMAFGQGFVRATPRVVLTGQSQNTLRVIVARPNVASLFGVVPTAATVRYGLAAQAFGIFLDDLDNQLLENIAAL